MPTIDLLQAEKFAEADKLRKDVLDPAYAKASDGIDALIKYQVDAAKNEYERALAIGKTIRIASVASIVVGLVLTMLIGFVITRSVSHGVSILADAAKEAVRRRSDCTREAGDPGRIGRGRPGVQQDGRGFFLHYRHDPQLADQVTCAAETQSSTPRNKFPPSPIARWSRRQTWRRHRGAEYDGQGSCGEGPVDFSGGA